MQHLRTVKSYVKRSGKITLGQKKALQEFWIHYGLELQNTPYDLEQIFKRNARRILEIGFGSGQSLLQYAKNQPDTDFIGIEVYVPGLGTLLADLAKQNINNVRLFNYDAVLVLQQCIPDNSIDKILIFFPDPWPKKRHHKRRLIQSEFINLVSRKLKPQGVLHLATDWQDYATHMLEVLATKSEFENTAGPLQFSARPDYRPLTRFELRGQTLGHPIFDLIFKKGS